MAAQPKIPKAWTRKQKDEADDKLYKQGYRSIVEDTSTLVIKGPKAQQIIKKRRKKPAGKTQ